MDLDAYRQSAESFHSEINLEYYRHFAGLQDDYEIESIYARHADLFTRPSVDALRELASGRGPETEERRRLRMLVDFAVEGFVGEATKAVEAELARVEAELMIEVDGEQLGFRQSSIVQANEPDAGRRARIERARLEVSERALQPLYVELTQLSHECARELGWPSYRVMCADCKAVDLEALAAQTQAFGQATEIGYAPMLDPEVRRTLGIGVSDLARSDLPRFFRAPEQDAWFPAQRLLPSFIDTMLGLGIDVSAQPGVRLDLEPRPKKSPRAFCAPVHVPGEVYLMLSPVGGRDDFGVLMHEAGHTEHCAHVDPELPFEFRYLGDNAITECFAFLFQHLIEDPEWLRLHLGIDDPAPLIGHARAQRMVYVRRYGAKLAYELELHGGTVAVGPELATRYSELLGGALRIEWPGQTFLSDVDPGFYCACYLRAWALETHLRAYLRERFGPAWFESREAGDALRELWRDGQRVAPEELLWRLTGQQLDFGGVLADLGFYAANGSSAHTR
jgi:hypothetical protein